MIPKFLTCRAFDEISIDDPSTCTARSDRAADPLYEVMLNAEPATTDKALREPPRATPEIVLFASFAFAISASGIIELAIPPSAILRPLRPTARDVPSRSIVKSETATDPLYEDIESPFPALRENKFEPRETPEIVLFASLAFAISESGIIELAIPPSAILIPAVPLARDVPSSLTFKTPPSS